MKNLKILSAYLIVSILFLSTNAFALPCIKAASKIKNGKVTTTLVSIERTACKKGEIPTTTGATGPTGPAGSDAQFNSASAGGDLTGTFPNPILGAGVVDPSTIATLPGAKIRRTSAFAVPNAGSYGSGIDFYNIQFDSVLNDSGGLYSNTNKFLNISTSGVYVVSGSVVWSANATGSRLAIVQIGGTQYFNNLKAYSESIPTIQTFSFIGRATAGQFIKLSVSQNSGAPLNTTDSSVGHAEITAQWIGP